MNPLKIFDAYAETWIEDGVFYKKYEGLPEWRWIQIAYACLVLSNEEISPPLLTINNVEYIMSWEEVIPFESSSEELPEGINLYASDIQRQISSLVNKLHKLGYAHGDLHIGNIGVIDGNRVVMLDFDSIIRIGDNEDWVQALLEIWDVNTIEELMEEEKTSWKTDVLYQ